MAFVPRLPTWNTTMVPWLWDAHNEWSEASPVDCQLYTFKRVAEVLGVEAMYVVYPKEEDVLRDPSQLPEGGLWKQWDAAAIDCGVQGTRWYWVIQVEPRWANFPNAHWVALLVRMTPADVILVTVGPPPLPGPGELAIDAAANDACVDCAVIDGAFALTFIAGNEWQSASFLWACSSTGSGIWQVIKTATFAYAVLWNDDFTLTYATWTADLTGWPGTYPIYLGIDAGGSSNDCVWPALLAVDLS